MENAATQMHVMVRTIYNVDTISRDNKRAWVKLLEYMETQPKNQPILFDFKDIAVTAPWVNLEFMKFIKDERVTIKVWCDQNLADTINLSCKMNGIKDVKAINEDIVLPKKLSDKELKIIRMGDQLQDYFDKTDPSCPVLKVYSRFDQIGSPDTVAYVEQALKKYLENNKVSRMVVDLDYIAVQANVIEKVTDLINTMKAYDVNLDIRSKDTEILKKVEMYRSLAGNRQLSIEDKYRIIKAKLTAGKVGMLIHYKESRAVDEFGRKGGGKPIISRAAIFQGVGKNPTTGRVCARFTEFVGGTFYTRVHWALEHDNEYLEKLQSITVDIDLEDLGMYSDFIGTKYHFITPVQYRQGDECTMYDVDSDGKMVYRKLTIPERMKAVFDDFDIKYDREGLDQYIIETEKQLRKPTSIID